jgi:lipopolysaccharide transport system permease protein
MSTATTHNSTTRITKIIRPPGRSLQDLVSGLAGLAHYRDLLYTLSVHRVKVRYKQSVLGIGWAILQPLSLMLIYTLVFSYIARVPSDGMPYAIFAYTALLPWSYFANALTSATTGLVSHSNLVTKVYFPREILPLTYVIAALFDLLIASFVLAGLMFYYRVSLTANVFYTIPIILVLTCLVTAVSLFLSAIQVRYRDVGVAMPLLLQLWMFATPVVYPLSAVPPRFQSIYVLNPMVGVIESFRRAVLQGLAPDFRSLAVAAGVTMVLLPLAYIYFKRVEATAADII